MERCTFCLTFVQIGFWVKLSFKVLLKWLKCVQQGIMNVQEESQVIASWRLRVVLPSRMDTQFIAKNNPMNASKSVESFKLIRDQVILSHNLCLQRQEILLFRP